MKVVLAGGPEPSPLLTDTEHEYSVSGVNSVTVSGPACEGERGREEGEGEQERV